MRKLRANIYIKSLIGIERNLHFYFIYICAFKSYIASFQLVAIIKNTRLLRRICINSRNTCTKICDDRPFRIPFTSSSISTSTPRNLDTNEIKFTNNKMVITIWQNTQDIDELCITQIIHFEHQ